MSCKIPAIKRFRDTSDFIVLYRKKQQQLFFKQLKDKKIEQDEGKKSTYVELGSEGYLAGTN